MLCGTLRRSLRTAAAATLRGTNAPPHLFRISLGSSGAVSTSPSSLLIASAASSSLAAMHPTRLLRRPQAVKPNPFTTESGKFDQSFEKMVGSLEQKLPFRQHHLKKGYIYDHNFGEENMDQMKEAARQDLEGREPEKQAARQARSYFTGEDLSPEAMHVRSPKLKVAQQIQRQKYDRAILKTTAEDPEYYYPEYSIQEKQRRTFVYWSCVAMLCGVAYMGWRRLAAYMRTDYDTYTLDERGQIQRVIRD